MSGKRPQEEAKLWQQMKRQTPDQILAYRVEVKNPPGMSDVYWTERTCYPPDARENRSTTGWIELKSQNPVVEPEQRLFLRAMRKQGVSAWVLAEWGDLLHLVDPLKIDLDLRIPFGDSKVTVTRTKNRSREYWRIIWANILGVPW